MTRNTFDDGANFSMAGVNAIVNAHDSEWVKRGCAPSNGSGSWDVDIASGVIRTGHQAPSVAAQTVTLTAPSNDTDLDSGEYRVDLVSVDSTGTAVVTEGVSGEGNGPVAPDIPSGNVLIAAVLVDGSASSLSSGDIHDYRVLADEGQDPLYGDGSDGSITRSTNGNENGIVTATDYTLDSGVTRDVTSGFLVLKATRKITINGTLNGTGQGASGGSGGSGSSGSTTAGNGGAGSNADVIPTSTGGSGGTGQDGAGEGGAGGDGDTVSTPSRQDVAAATPNQLIQPLIESSAGTAGAGGGGGGGGKGNSAASTTVAGGNGSAPSGGGGGGRYAGADATGGAGGDGGAGGAFIILMAPEIEIGGTVQAAGTDGATGNVANGIGGGGGGGGNGGLVAIITPDLVENSPTYDTSGGAGGAGGNGSNVNGGNGASGDAGSTIKVTR